ncbi:hypothetical protein DIURU_005529 [Diutina rugosa]|uniref:Methyltransferase type 12 domain-containing protein n=1 Tax=Diutina rugosa TaxID=5481 RepID=A0A642UD76_DIURU|nr:uncharacterized protein DIURU_005529 [Diutina rugosa]KAA8897016.1 hypothetical protein DIURU_005529 [Diutina rugosa]
MSFNYEDHKKAIAANIKALNPTMAESYEVKPTINASSVLFAKTMLEFDWKHPQQRKSNAESETPVGNPDKDNYGISEADLPSPQTYLKDYPNTIFRPGAKVMDFAAGTGLVTTKLVPYLPGSEIVGVDINPAFLAKFEAKEKALREQGVNISHVEVDIMDPSKKEELDAKFKRQFDIIFCTLSYHHIDNYEDVTVRLCEFLAPGGELIIIDFYNEDLENVDVERLNADESFAVRHMGGLKKEVLHSVLQDKCGLTNVSVAREFRFRMWNEAKFINGHCDKQTIDDLNAGKLPTKQDPVDGTVYLIDSSIVMAIGQQPK